MQELGVVAGALLRPRHPRKAKKHQKCFDLCGVWECRDGIEEPRDGVDEG